MSVTKHFSNSVTVSFYAAITMSVSIVNTAYAEDEIAEAFPDIFDALYWPVFLC